MGKQDLDNYPTPAPLCVAITGFLHELFPGKTKLIEPACGAGTFIQSAMQRWQGQAHLGVEISEGYRPYVEQLGCTFYCSDFLAAVPVLAQNNWFGPETLIYGNPPYGEDLPQRFIETISAHAAPGTHIAFLLRQSFLGGVNRALYFKERKSLRVKRDVAGRPKFDVTSKSQDHSEYGVFVYEVGYRGHYIGWEDPLLWKPKHLKEAQTGKLLVTDVPVIPRKRRSRKATAQAA